MKRQRSNKRRHTTNKYIYETCPSCGNCFKSLQQHLSKSNECVTAMTADKSHHVTRTTSAACKSTNKRSSSVISRSGGKQLNHVVSNITSTHSSVSTETTSCIQELEEVQSESKLNEECIVQMSQTKNQTSNNITISSVDNKVANKESHLSI